MDLAAYSLITEDNAAQYYPDYAWNHPVFTDGMRIYSDSEVGRFLSSSNADERIAFLNKWNEKRDHRETIYISYDSTNKHCQAGDIELAEIGHEKDKQGKPVFLLYLLPRAAAKVFKPLAASGCFCADA